MSDEAALIEDCERWLRIEWLANKIGKSFGRRKLPRVRECSGRLAWWALVPAIPCKTRRAAFRMARKLRMQTGRQYAVAPDPKRPGRKTVDWRIYARR